MPVLCGKLKCVTPAPSSLMNSTHVSPPSLTPSLTIKWKPKTYVSKSHTSSFFNLSHLSDSMSIVASEGEHLGAILDFSHSLIVQIQSISKSCGCHLTIDTLNLAHSCHPHQHSAVPRATPSHLAYCNSLLFDFLLLLWASAFYSQESSQSPWQKGGYYSASLTCGILKANLIKQRKKWW